MSCGIYKITHRYNGKSYIGQSIHIEERWKEHLRGKGNQPLHEAILKDGINYFKFEILELCPKEELFEKEKYWISYYDTYNHGYNLNDGSNNHMYATEKTKKEIFCYDLEGNFIKKYLSLSDAERDTNIDNSNISRAAKTNGRTKNYQWSYTYVKKMTPYKRHTGNVGKNSGKAINQYDKNMKFIKEYPSAKEAERITGINNSSINQVCNFKRKTAGGYIWRFKGE